MASIYSATWTALTVLVLAPLANDIPKAALAGMLIVIAYSMVEKHRLALAWKSGFNSRVVLFGTLGATLVLRLEYAIFVGIFLSIFFLLKITGKTDLTQLIPRSDGGFDEVPFNRAAPSPVVTVNIEGDLYFAAVEDLDYRLQQALTPETRVVVLRMKRLRAVGSTAMAILEHFWRILCDRNISLVVCGIEPDLTEMMTRSGLRSRIGEPNIFFADNKLFQSTELATARAWSIVTMERRRREAAERPAPAAARPVGLTARDVMGRQCIRFGEGHQLREAIWLLSEMNRRGATPETHMLFLQDREGKLAGALSVWRLLEEMALAQKSDGAASPDGATSHSLTARPSDATMGKRFSRRFAAPISSLARKDLPHCGPDTPFTELARRAVQENLCVLPICDTSGRVVGLVGERDLLAGLGRLMQIISPAGRQIGGPAAPAAAASDRFEDAELWNGRDI